MSCVYRYKDMWTNEIHYVGIVWSKTRTLNDRVREHYKNEEWCRSGCYVVESLDVPVTSRTDAEFYEAHYISLYNTGEFYNKRKANMGISSLIPDNEDKWKYHSVSFPVSTEDKKRFKQIYTNIIDSKELENFDYFNFSIHSEDGWDGAIYKTEKRENSFDEVYDVVKEMYPDEYGYFSMEQLTTISDLTTKILLSGLQFEEIVENELLLVDPLGEDFIACNTDIKYDNVLYVSEAEAWM